MAFELDFEKMWQEVKTFIQGTKEAEDAMLTFAREAAKGMNVTKLSLEDAAGAALKYKQEVEGLKNASSVTGGETQKMAEALRKVTEEAEEAAKASEEFQKQTGDLNDEMGGFINSLGIAGVTIGDVRKKLGDFSKSLKATATNMKGAAAATTGTSKALKIFRAALISTGVGALVVALGSLIAYLTNTQKGIDFVNRTMLRISATFSVLTERAASLGKMLISTGKALGSLAKFDLKGMRKNFKDAGDAGKEAFEGITDEMRETWTVAGELSDRQQQLKEDIVDLTREEAELRKQRDELRELAKQENITLAEREKLLMQVSDIEGTIADKRLKVYREELALQKELNELGFTSVEDRQKVADIEAKISGVEQERARNNRRWTGEIVSARKQAAAAAEEERKRIQDLRDAYAEMVQDVTDTIEQNRIEGLIGEERIEAERVAAEKALDKMEEAMKKAAEAAGVAYDPEHILKLREQAQEAYLAQLDEFHEEERQKELDNIQESLDNERKAQNDHVNLIVEWEKSRIDLITESGDEELTLEEFKQQELLRIERTAAQKRLKLIEEQFGENSMQAQIMRNQILSFDREIENIGKTVDTGKIYNNLQDVFDDKFRDNLQELFGFDDAQMDVMLQTVKDVFGNIYEAITASTDHQIAENERLLDALNDRIDRTEDALDRELQLAEMGYASNVEGKKEELDALYEQEREAKAKQQELEEKAARQKQAAERVQQASSLATAVANIYSNFSSIPLVGLILAGAAIASMFALFSSYKSRAKKLYRGGELPIGKNDKYGEGYKILGTDYEVGGGEFIVNSETTAKQRGFIRKLNAGKYDGVDLDRAVQRGVMREAISNRAVRIQGATSELYELRKHTALLTQIANKPERFEDRRGEVTKKGNYTKVLKK